jgi:RNA polymerase sigma factor (sigma-70 family)
LKTRNEHDRVIAVIQANAASLLRLARRHAICADDANDAYQRALEIYLQRADRVDDATAGSWLRTVVKHEAMRIRAGRQRSVPGDEIDFDSHTSTDVGDVADRMEGFERVARAAEALQGCKPDEVRALLLKADGSSYAEIGELLGWTYTKVNRCLTEGRARFLTKFAEIEEGSACDRWSPVLSAIVDGEATPDDFAAVRPHLRHCSACRATLRSLYEAQPALGGIVPAGGLVVAAGATEAVHATGGVLARVYEAMMTGLGDRIMRAQAVVDAIASSKGAAVVASTAAVAGGGVTALHVERGVAMKAPRAEIRKAAPERGARASRPAAERGARPAPVTRSVTPRAVAVVPRPPPAAPLPRPAAAPTPAPAREFALEPVRATSARTRTASSSGEFGFEG